MTKMSTQYRLAGVASKAQFLLHLKRFAALVAAALLLNSWTARATEPDEEYLRIYGLIQQTDALTNSGQADQALAKYRALQIDLQRFQRSNLDWNAKVVSYRMNYLAEKIATLSEKSAATTASATQAVSAAQVKLLDAGAEPRAVLRLHPKPGDTQSLDLTMKMAMDMKAGEMQVPATKLPAVKMSLDATVKSVSAEGDILFDLVVGEVGVVDEPGAMPQVVQAMKASFTAVKGLSGTGTMSNRGFNKETRIPSPASADPQTRQAIEQVKNFLSTCTVPLPEEAVGAGARWEVKMPLKSQGMTIDQTTTYEIVSLDSERLTAKSTQTQQAANQKIENPAMPGLKVDLTKMTGTGTGTVACGLAQLLPTEETIDSHSEMSMGMNMGGQTQPMALKLDLNVTVKAK
jgi:hypothetical protein